MIIRLNYHMWYRTSERRSLGDHYAAMLDHCELLDSHGLDMVKFFEHHGAACNFNPSPLVAAAGAAARTRNARIIPLVLAPLYEPLKLAEDLAVLDHLSNGRVSIIIAANYRAEESTMFAREHQQRRMAVDRTVDVLRSAWTGEPFEFEGRTVQVRPAPAQRPRPPILMAFGSAAGARAAALLADEVDLADYVAARYWQVYIRELARLGKPVPQKQPFKTIVCISEDPERDRPMVEACAQDHSDTMADWAHRPRPRLREDPDGTALVLTPDQAIRALGPLAAANGVLKLSPLYSGVDPDLAATTIDLLVNKVLPRLPAGPSPSKPPRQGTLQR